jgi:hypothetical protein
MVMVMAAGDGDECLWLGSPYTQLPHGQPQAVAGGGVGHTPWVLIQGRMKTDSY